MVSSWRCSLLCCRLASLAASGFDELSAAASELALACASRALCCAVRLAASESRLLHGLLDQLITATLAEPRLHAMGQGAILPRRKNSHLAVAARLGIHLAHGRLVRRKLLLNPGAHVAGGPGQVVLGIVQLVLIKIELCLGNFQIVIGGSAGAWGLNSAPGPGLLSPSPAVAPPSARAQSLRLWAQDAVR